MIRAGIRTFVLTSLVGVGMLTALWLPHAARATAPSSSAAPAAAHGHAEPSLSDVNWWQWDDEKLPVGWFFIDFAVFLAIVGAGVNKPLRLGLQDRHMAVKKAIADAAATHARASEAYRVARHKLTTLEAEVQELEQSSLRDGEAERAQLIAHAHEYAARLDAEQLAQADEGVRRLHERLRRTLLSGILRDAQQEFVAIVQTKDHARLLDEAIANLATAQPETARRSR